MNDGFVMSHNSESVETKEYMGLDKVLGSDLDIEGGTEGEVKPLDLTPDDEILDAMKLAQEILETPTKKGTLQGTTRDCNTSYTLGSAMKGNFQNCLNFCIDTI